MKKVGIIAALPAELKPLVTGWHQQGEVFLGQLGTVECVAVSAGMGAAAATRACELALQHGPLDALVSMGWAGAISCGVKPPDAFAVSEVVDSTTGERYSTGQENGQRLVTIDHVARGSEKRKLAEQFRAPLADMEAATVAAIAREKGIAFYCFKGISDGYTDKLPDFNRFMDENGQLRMPAFITYAVLHPGYWKPLQQLGKNSKSAASNLARLVSESLSQTL